ncbi:MAG: hypothetical protein FWF97_02780 [Alphaproteobacteria bacterium]|nr:hypothetical protein [Alphaproteobacteria bacterium]
MKKLAGLFFLILCVGFAGDAFPTGEKFANCGPGYVLISNGTLEGVTSQKCEKLWCRDLENGRSMGSGNTPASGYVATTRPVLLEAAGGYSIECFGDRKWCTGEVAGRWNPEFGAYTRRGEDSVSFLSSQKGDCFAWQSITANGLGCAPGQIPIFANGKWACGATETGAATDLRRITTTGGGIRRGGASIKAPTVIKK